MAVLLVTQAWAADLSAEQIVANNVAARGGLEAWRKIQTMLWTGHLQSSHTQMPSMVFIMQQKRPNKVRFDISTVGQKSVRIFDGERGWKIKPSREGGPEIQPYPPEEVKYAQAAQVIDGPLIDYVAKGNAVTLESLDEMDGHKVYRLSVHLGSGETDRVWIDAKSFLEVRYDRPVSSAPGAANVSVFYGNYQTFAGLRLPTVIQTATAPGMPPDQMVIEKVMLNAPVDERSFSPPGARSLRGSPPTSGQLPAPQRPKKLPPLLRSMEAPAAPSAGPASGPN